MLKHLPLLGVLGGTIVFIVATCFYPGGTLTNIDSVGYDWAGNTISALFQPYALNGC